MPVLFADHINYPAKGKTIHRVISREVKRREGFALSGHNGSGKSTLIEMMTGWPFDSPGGVTRGNISSGMEVVVRLRAAFFILLLKDLKQEDEFLAGFYKNKFTPCYNGPADSDRSKTVRDFNSLKQGRILPNQSIINH